MTNSLSVISAFDLTGVCLNFDADCGGEFLCPSDEFLFFIDHHRRNVHSSVVYCVVYGVHLHSTYRYAIRYQSWSFYAWYKRRR